MMCSFQNFSARINSCHYFEFFLPKNVLSECFPIHEATTYQIDICDKPFYLLSTTINGANFFGQLTHSHVPTQSCFATKHLLNWICHVLLLWYIASHFNSFITISALRLLLTLLLIVLLDSLLCSLYLHIYIYIYDVSVLPNWLTLLNIYL